VKKQLRLVVVAYIFTFGFDFAFRVFSVCGVVWVSTCDFIAYATVTLGLVL
jgi:hypothetical protein